jgi:hypothetical protein
VAALIRCEQLCRGCSRQECFDLPTVENPISLECPECNGVGTWDTQDGIRNCVHCNGAGRFEVLQCPNSYIGQKLTREINLASWAEKGHLPNLGGVLDQEAFFMNVWAAMQSDIHKIDEESRRNHE